MRLRGIVLSAALSAALCGLAADASAYQTVSSFIRSANDGGGSKMMFTGSPRFRGYDCTVCHIGAAQRMKLALTSDPPGLFSDASYKPWQVYSLTVEMVGEHRGLEAEPNENLFVAEMLDDAGEPLRSFSETELGTLQRVEGNLDANGAVVGASQRSSWTFQFEAPGPGTGRLSFYISAVDGDAAATQPDPPPPTDPQGDDVFTGRWRICEEFVACESEFTEQADDTVSPTGHGCSMGRGAGALPIPLAALLLALALSCRRRSRCSGSAAKPCTHFAIAAAHRSCCNRTR